ncbi:MAG: hypothetical protein ABSF91_08530 [Bacteroidota bacterium]|jgi:hypothetical protein
MMINDEIIEDKDFSSIPSERQNELVNTYCSGLEERLRAVSGQKEALEIIDATCKNFDAECESDIVRSYLRKYVDSLFFKIWERK